MHPHPIPHCFMLIIRATEMYTKVEIAVEFSRPLQAAGAHSGDLAVPERQSLLIFPEEHNSLGLP